MKVLMTGHRGFIGTHLVNALNKHFEIIGFDLKNSQYININDINDFNMIDDHIDVYKPDIVCHLAALPSVPDSYERPAETFQTNLAGSINVAMACKKHKVKKLVVASSSSIYGNSPYGLSKKMMEDALTRMDINVCILRYFNVFGPNQPLRAVIPLWIDAIAKNETVYCNGSSAISRDFTYIDNIIRANYVAITGSDTGIFEVGGGKSVTLRDVYETIRRYMNPSHDKFVVREERFGDLKKSESKKDMWITEPIISFEEGIQKWVSTLVSSESVQSAER